jgi:hypothetical protein
VEEELSAGSEGQLTKLIENDEDHPGQMIGEPSSVPIASLGLEPVDEIDDVLKPTTSA